MNSLSIENRVSLSRERENGDILKKVEELSSSYANREDYALNHSNVFKRYTSEICTVPGVCLAIVVGAVYTFGVVVSAGAVLIVGVNWVGVHNVFDSAMVDSVIYRNIV